MKKVFMAILTLVFTFAAHASNGEFGSVGGKDLCEQVASPMDAAKCKFIEVMTKKSNPEVEKVRSALQAQGFSRGNVSTEELNAVFIRGTYDGGKGRYTYLITTDVATMGGHELKSIGLIISSKIDTSSDADPRVERVISSDLLK